MMFQSVQTFCEGQIHWKLPLSYAMALCVWHVSIRFCLSTMTLQRCAAYIQERLVSFSLLSWAQFEKCLHLLVLIFVDSLTSFLLFLSAHFQIVSTATIKLVDHTGFVCALILGFTVNCMHVCTTDTNYVMFCVVWCKSLKDSMALVRNLELCMVVIAFELCFKKPRKISINFRDIRSRKVKVVFSVQVLVWFLHMCICEEAKTC